MPQQCVLLLSVPGPVRGCLQGNVDESDASCTADARCATVETRQPRNHVLSRELPYASLSGGRHARASGRFARKETPIGGVGGPPPNDRRTAGTESGRGPESGARPAGRARAVAGG